MNVPRIKAIQPLPERQLLVTFVNGIQKVYDCREIMKLDRFQMLKHEAFFKLVAVDPGGYGISWDDEMDLSEYELWANGIEISAASEMIDQKHSPQVRLINKKNSAHLPKERLVSESFAT